MPVSFSRLRIAGFKSFAEPVTVDILPGLTGIVGPNGCGKSNVVEALRWAMGETSARALRGGEMEDVIFAGTGARAARNIAEVTLSLADAEGVAPPPFHEQSELEISRRIERGMGSLYRVNGREARARDVQTLFADLASGARASAMVSQGRVAALVNAKPEERRAVLEEAAGITGLHARRHEAELKLRAAEANLTRAEELCGQLETQLASLKRQARQASRYRNISGAVRAAEQELLAIQRARAAAARAEAEAALSEARARVAEATAEATGASAQAATSEAALTPLREAESAARAALERHRLTREHLEQEAARARAAAEEAARRVGEIARDLAHSEAAARDAEAAIARLRSEDEALVQAEAGHEMREAAATEAALAAAEAEREAEAAANRATEEAARAAAAAQSTTQELARAEEHARRLAGQLAQTEAEQARLCQSAVAAEAVSAAEAAREAAEQRLSAARAALEEAEQRRAAAEAALTAARAADAAAQSARARAQAEAQALAEILAVKDGERWPPMLDQISVPDGLETALGAALGDALSSAADPAAARHWRDLPALAAAAPLPAGATALSASVQAPPALARALSQIGLIDAAAGDAAQAALAPGQILVSREGAVWRWDGYTILAGTKTEAAVRLAQRNRLIALRAALARAEAEAARTASTRQGGEAAAREANAADLAARSARREAEQNAERLRAEAARLAARAANEAARLSAVEETRTRQHAEKQEADAALAQARAEAATLPDLAALRAAVNTLRDTLTARRNAAREAQASQALLAREQAARTARRAAIGPEIGQWQERASAASERAGELAARRVEAEAAAEAIRAEPEAIAARRAEAIDALDGAEGVYRRAAAALQEAGEQARATDRAARAAEARLAALREDAVRAEGLAAQAAHGWGSIAERILERLGVDAALPEPPEPCNGEAEEKARRKLDRLIKEREEMGPVNLRAEIEAGEVETQIATITTERGEITTAIAKLRGSIGHLNREGRERLASVFAEVDRHFQSLFSRMFGGGRAHLALVGSDDPLVAGLEIYAQPPGKKLATLSLLSGGEQALTALSLIFAVFRCNPAPVCVLDEVDAPLDDANVERFCALLEDMVREAGTRFLVVTHHPLTMARMDRLYGVTMQERGVSRVLSVDLGTAAGMVDAPRMAAE